MDRREALRVDLDRGGQLMESALMTGLVLIVYAGLVGGCLMLFDTVREAHRQGIARVRAYDKRQESNK